MAPALDMADAFPRSAVGLTAPKMLAASPQLDGEVLKLRVAVWYALLPRFLQRWLGWFSCFAPKWQRRHLILLGSFLYRFAETSSPSEGPKGTPVPVEAMEVHIVACSDPHDDDSDVAEALINLPNGYTCVLVVETLRQKRHYAVKNREEAELWLNSLRSARQEAIRRTLGHAPDGSYPRSWEYFDQLGRALLDRKDRMRIKLQERNLQELELSSLGEGGPLPRGYFG